MWRFQAKKRVASSKGEIVCQTWRKKMRRRSSRKRLFNTVKCGEGEIKSEIFVADWNRIPELMRTFLTNYQYKNKGGGKNGYEFCCLKVGAPCLRVEGRSHNKMATQRKSVVPCVLVQVFGAAWKFKWKIICTKTTLQKMLHHLEWWVRRRLSEGKSHALKNSSH